MRRFLAALVAFLVMAAPAQAVTFGVTTSGVNSVASDPGSALDAYTALVGKQPASANWFQNWSPTFTGSALVRQPAMDAMQARGVEPMVTWIPKLTDGTCLSLQAITNGDYDAYLTKAADEAKAFGHPFYIRPWHEFNGRWTCYQVGPDYTNSPSSFVAAWRHVVKVFRHRGATNVAWVWCPGVIGVNSSDPSPAYPGDRFVDWIAMDGYNMGSTTWRSFTTIFSATYTKLAKVGTRPMMLAETSSDEGTAGQKAAWITDAFKTAIQKMPRIKVMQWWNIPINGHAYNVDSSASSLDAFRQVTN